MFLSAKKSRSHLRSNSPNLSGFSNIRSAFYFVPVWTAPSRERASIQINFYVQSQNLTERPRFVFAVFRPVQAVHLSGGSKHIKFGVSFPYSTTQDKFLSSIAGMASKICEKQF